MDIYQTEHDERRDDLLRAICDQDIAFLSSFSDEKDRFVLLRRNSTMDGYPYL